MQKQINNALAFKAITDKLHWCTPIQRAFSAGVFDSAVIKSALYIYATQHKQLDSITEISKIIEEHTRTHVYPSAEETELVGLYRLCEAVRLHEPIDDTAVGALSQEGYETLVVIAFAHGSAEALEALWEALPADKAKEYRPSFVYAASLICDSNNYLALTMRDYSDFDQVVVDDMLTKPKYYDDAELVQWLLQLDSRLTQEGCKRANKLKPEIEATVYGDGSISKAVIAAIDDDTIADISRAKKLMGVATIVVTMLDGRMVTL